MEHEESKIIIQYLTILELPLDKQISKEVVKSQYRKLVHVYHPDASVDVYHDGERFKLLQKAYEYLSNDFDYVNSLIANNFQARTSFNDSYSSSYKESSKESNYYQTKPTYQKTNNDGNLDSIFSNNWKRTRKFHFVSSAIGVVLAIFIFAFGFLGYVAVTHYEGVAPTGGYVHYWYNLYESTAESYGVYHCAVAFNFVVIGLLLIGFILVFIQLKAKESSWKSAFARLILNFLTFGLAIPLAVFHMIVAGGQMYATGSGGEIVLTIFTWLIIVLFFFKTIISLVPFIKFALTKIK